MQPYPSHLVQRLTLADGTVATIRPIRSEDAGIDQEFVRNLSHESRYFRFRDAARELSPRMLAQLTRVDYDRHLALIAREKPHIAAPESPPAVPPLLASRHPVVAHSTG